MAYIFREATLADVPVVLSILRQGAERMLREGKCQWTETYPGLDNILNDIANRYGYVLDEIDGSTVAYGAVVFTGEKAYDKINGDWLTTDDSRYVVVHRLAVSEDVQQKGMAKLFLKSVENLAVERSAVSFRIDTNFDNERMLSLLKRCGFDYCGEVYYPQGSRLAFEKLI